MRATAFLAGRSFGRSSIAKDPMQTLQPIPTLPDVETPAAIVALELFRLFDATVHARPYTVTLHERTTPGAAAALRAWSEANGLTTVEDHYPSMEGRPAYANLTTAITEHGTRIVVLAYRELTDEEAAVVK